MDWWEQIKKAAKDLYELKVNHRRIINGDTIPDYGYYLWIENDPLYKDIQKYKEKKAKKERDKLREEDPGQATLLDLLEQGNKNF